MTLPASGAISLTAVMNELRIANGGRAYPINLGDTDVRALAGVSSGTIGLSNLYGKSSYNQMVISGSGGSGYRDTALSGGTVSATVSLSVSSGNPGYTYSWAVWTQDPGMTVTTSFVGSTFGMSATVSRHSSGSKGASLQVTITDSTGHTAARNFGINLTYEDTSV